MYKPNQYQNQGQQIVTNHPQVMAQNKQYKYPGYTQQNQIVTNPQYQNVQFAQNTNANYQNVQQAYQQRQQPNQNNQNILYYQVPGKPNNYNQYAQNEQQIIGQTPLNQNVNPVIQDPNLVKNIQIANQMVQLQQQKMIPKQLNQGENLDAAPIQNQKKVEPKFQAQVKGQNLNKEKKTPSLMSVYSLSELDYKDYPKVEFSKKPFLFISGYGCNTYHGTTKNYNEDKIKVLYKVLKTFNSNEKEYQALISYFGLFSGHGGDKCSQYLKENLDGILFNQTKFPNNVIESIKETFITAENKFKSIAIQNGKLVDKSGSSALIALIINYILYIINLGDSRGLYSRNDGNEFYQITRDHKPNDSKEKARIEKAGGQVYYANKVNVYGKEITLKEEQFGPGFKFPYLLFPGNLPVSFIYIFIYYLFLYRS